jgi:hypothetical protein
MKKLFVLFVAIALVGGFAVSAMAAEWSFFGSARMSTFYQDYDEEAGDDADTTWDLQGNARIGANVKAGAIGGGFEYGSGPNLRKLFGTWNFGAGELLVGQTYTPLGSMFYSNQVWASDEDLLSIGQCYNGRQPMLQLSIQGLKLALVKPNNPGVAAIGGDVDTLLPKVELSYSLKTDVFFMDVYGGFQTYEIETPAETYDVNAYVGGIGGGVNLGPAYVKLNGYYARNHGQYGLYSGANPVKDGSRDVGYDPVEDDLIETDSIGGLAVVGFKASDMLTFELGCGYIQHERDDDDDATDKNDAMSYYGNVTINIAPGFFVVPEVGVVDWADDALGNDEGSMTYFGAKWQINF